jgi:hypothetical protein
MASAVATIMASVTEGSSASARPGPPAAHGGSSDMAAMVMKNSAARASGWRQKRPDAQLDPGQAGAGGNDVEFHGRF